MLVIPLSSVIPTKVGIQTYLDKNLSYIWIPASAGMTRGRVSATCFRRHRLRRNDKREPGFPLSRE